MAHYARVIDNVVVRVHTVANYVIMVDGIEEEVLGKEFLANLHGYEIEELVQCSYNATFRAFYPGIGWGYDPDTDEFVPPVMEELDEPEA